MVPSVLDGSSPKEILGIDSDNKRKNYQVIKFEREGRKGLKK